MNFLKIFLDSKSIIKKYYWIAGVPILICGYILSEASRQDIEENLAKTFGVVQNSRPVYQKPSKKYYDYEFVFKATKYRGSSVEYISKDIEIGKIYLVEFSELNPEHSRMVFDQEYSEVIQKGAFGKKDTVYITVTLLPREIPENLENRLDSLRK